MSLHFGFQRWEYQSIDDSRLDVKIQPGRRMLSEKFSLKWNDYQSNWSQSLSGLRDDTEMSDVTLITEDKVKVSTF